MIAKEYGWSLEEIRNLDYIDFMSHLQLCLAGDAMEKEFDLRLAGVDPDKPKHVSAEQVLRGGQPKMKEYIT